MINETKKIKDNVINLTSDELKAIKNGVKTQHRVLTTEKVGNVGDLINLGDVRLKVAGIHKEKLWQTNDNDAQKCGINEGSDGYLEARKSGYLQPFAYAYHKQFRKRYGSEVWRSRPFVWVIDFKLVT